MTTVVITRRAVQVVLALVALGGSVAFARVRHRGRWREHAAERVASVVERLGGAFLKGGQFLSTRRDLVGPTLAHALGRLQDDVRPMPAADAVRVVERAGVGHADAVRRAVLAGPVASGSIACVYRVVLPDRVVALKVRKPEAVRQITADTRIIRGLARALALVPVFRGVPLGDIADQLCGCVLDQLDFDRERRNLRRFGELTADLDAVTVPGVVDGMCGDGVLAMDFLDGLDRSPDAGPELAAAVETLVRAMYESMFLHGFVHVDLHQGNAYFRPGGDVVVVDFGFVYQLGDFARTKFTAFFAGMIDGDGAGCADTLLSTARAVSGAADLAGFRRDVADLVRRNCGRAVRDFSLPRFAAALFDLQRRYGVHADPEFTFPLLSLLALDGVVKQHHPEMDFQLEAAPFVMAGLLEAGGSA
ncbi:ABC1 kinase family protein [Actinosynnema sp. NPDC091369]